MKFRIRYEGDLKSRQQCDLAHIHAIRKFIHGQLKSLWEAGAFEEEDSSKISLYDVPTGSHSFRVLATQALSRAVELGILLLRYDPAPITVISGGDLDNRLKTLIDALRAPTKQEIEQGLLDIGSNPFYCLLDDDKRIRQISVEADRLYDPPRERHSLAVISVRIIALKATWANAGLPTSQQTPSLAVTGLAVPSHLNDARCLDTLGEDHSWPENRISS